MRKIPLVLLGCIVLAALLAPWLAPYDPAQQLNIVTLKNSVPSFAHPLGTDPYSRDLLSRVLFGARTSLLVGFVATAMATILGCAWGGAAAIAGARVGELLMLVVDIARSVPRMLLFIVAVALLGSLQPILLAVVLGFAAWPVTARLTYVLACELRGRDYVEAARAVGAGKWNVLITHIVPQLAGPLAASGTLLLADVLAVESGLSFLGIGVRPPTASWGSMVQDALPYLGSAWWVAAVPCTFLLATVLAATTVVDTLHEKRQRGPAALSER